MRTRFTGHRCVRLQVLILILAVLLPPLSWAANEHAIARLPLVHVDTSPAPVEGRVIRVAPGDNLQKALYAAIPGDVLELVPGGLYQGPFLLPKKSGSGWITIRSAAGSIPLPGPGKRVSPEHAPAMARLVSRSGPVIGTEPGAHHYRFVGIEIAPDNSKSLWQHLKDFVAAHTERSVLPHTLTNLVELTADSADAADIPHHIIFDRCYLHGDSRTGTRRGIAMNSAHSAVVNSWLSNFRAIGQDSQAIAGWDGPGPYKINNNYLEGAGENLMFGGGDPTVHGMVPSDIEIRGNHFSKPLTWKADHPDFEGTVWQVKNLLELKNARRVLIDGNLFENNWPQAQNGFAILFTVRNQDGTAPWSVVEDVTFTNNVIRHVAAGINILGRDDIHVSRITRNIDIRNNLFEDLAAEFGGNGRLFQLLDGIDNIRIDGNTAFSAGHILLSEGRSHPDLSITNNLLLYRAEAMANRPAGSATIRVANSQQALVWGNVVAASRFSSFPGFQRLEEELRAAGLELAATVPDGAHGSLPGMRLQSLCRSMSAADHLEYCRTGQWWGLTSD